MWVTPYTSSSVSRGLRGMPPDALSWMCTIEPSGGHRARYSRDNTMRMRSSASRREWRLVRPTRRAEGGTPVLLHCGGEESPDGDVLGRAPSVEVALQRPFLLHG